MIVVQAGFAQLLPFAGMGSGEDLGPKLAGKLDREAADSAAAAWIRILSPAFRAARSSRP